MGWAATWMTPRRLRQLWYVPLLVLAMGLMLARLLAVARVLDLTGFAAFSGGLLVSGTFCMLGCLGLQALLQREWPMQLVRGRERHGPIRAAQCSLVALTCAVTGLIVAVSGVSPGGMTPGLLAVGALHGLSQQFFLVATVESRSRGDMLRFSLQNLVRAIVAMVASVLVAWSTGSAILALAADALLSMALSVRFFAVSLALAGQQASAIYALAWRRLRAVPWRSALQLSGVIAVGFALLNADRWVASSQFSATGFAQYAFAWTVLSTAQSAQGVINAAVYPMLSRRFGSAGREETFALCLKVSLAVMVIGGVLAFPLVWGLAWSIRRWYAPYADAIVVLPIFLAVAVLRASDFWSSFMLISGFEGRLLRLNLVAALLGSLIWVVGIQLGAGPSESLTQVAWLAAALTICNHAFVGWAAWMERRA